MWPQRLTDYGHLEQAFDTSRTTHYLYEPNSFVPLMQVGYAGGA
jgi:hypothetical protein